MAQKLAFTTLDVFTTERYMGNPLAIVHLPPSLHNLEQSKKQLIAKEFNYSETVFLHEGSEEGEPVVIDIFIVSAEIPFAGHPTVGTSWFLLTRSNGSSVTLRTKAGDIPATLDSSQQVTLKVPVDFKVHAPETLAPADKQTTVAKREQARLNADDWKSGLDGDEPVVSIVKGMTFILIQLNSEDALTRMGTTTTPLSLSSSVLGEWKGSFVGVYAYFVREDGLVRTRMFDASLEDPATGSAASALTGYLATQKGPGEWKFEVLQGVEMGRRSEIGVTVNVGSNGEIQDIHLRGKAVKVMEGFLEI